MLRVFTPANYSFPLFLLLACCLSIGNSLSAQAPCSSPESADVVLNPPPPATGVYPPGTVVNMCITIVDFQATNNNWLHSIVPTFPPLYDISTFTPTSIPASCSGAGTWDWYPSGWTGCETGIAIPPAFGFDSGLGLQCGGVAGDGDPGNNFGEGGACATINLPSEYLTFCWILPRSPPRSLAPRRMRPFVFLFTEITIRVVSAARLVPWTPPCVSRSWER